MPYAEYVEAPRSAGLGQHIDYAAVEGSIAKACGFVKHGVEKMDTLLAGRFVVEKAEAELGRKVELPEIHLGMQAWFPFRV